MTSVPEFITDELWRALLRLAAPDLHHNTGESLSGRRRAEHVTKLLFIDAYCTSDNAPSFAEYAKAGTLLIQGLRSMDFLRESLQIYTEGSNARPFYNPRFSDELIQQIENAREALNAFHDLIDKRITERYEPAKDGPNAKPALHAAVFELWDVWTDLTGPRKRLKKDFLFFAYCCLRQAQAGITENSILESFDRHVRPNRQNARLSKRKEAIAAV